MDSARIKQSRNLNNQFYITDLIILLIRGARISRVAFMNRLTLVAGLIGMLLLSIASNSNFGKEFAYAQDKENKDSIQYVGVNVRDITPVFKIQDTARHSRIIIMMTASN